jgi:hypothetical protein
MKQVLSENRCVSDHLVSMRQAQAEAGLAWEISCSRTWLDGASGSLKDDCGNWNEKALVP